MTKVKGFQEISYDELMKIEGGDTYIPGPTSQTIEGGYAVTVTSGTWVYDSGGYSVTTVKSLTGLASGGPSFYEIHTITKYYDNSGTLTGTNAGTIYSSGNYGSNF